VREIFSDVPLAKGEEFKVFLINQEMEVKR